MLERLRAKREALRGELEELDAAIADVLGEENAPEPVPFAEFLAQPDKDLHWILAGLMVPGSINLLAAGGGIGKTTLLSQIALCLGAGRDFLSFRVSKPHVVLAVQAEGAREAFRQRLKRAARSLRIEEPDLRGFVQPEGFGDFIIAEGGVGRLVRRVKPDLTVLDTVSFMHRGSENDAAEWKRNVMRPLKEIVRDTGTAFVLVHHEKKADPRFPDPRASRARGTTAMHDDADLVLSMEKNPTQDGRDTGNRTLVVVKNRYGLSDTQTPLHFHSQDAIFTEGHTIEANPGVAA